MNRVAIWPFSTLMDSSGRMTDELQGVYSRGFCRAFAEGLLRTEACAVAVCLPIVTIGEVTSWAVMGREWNLDEALAIQLPEGAEFLVFGTISIAKRVDLHMNVVWHSQRCSLVDQYFSYPREQILNCLSEAVLVLAGAIVGRPLNEEENQQLQRWGTNNPKAYLAYLEAWSAGTAFRLGVSVPRRQAALECALEATRIDPAFMEAYRLQKELGSVGVRSQSDKAERIGYLEFAYPIAVPNQDVVPQS